MVLDSKISEVEEKLLEASQHMRTLTLQRRKMDLCAGYGEPGLLEAYHNPQDFHEVTRLVQVYKPKTLSFVEYRTLAVYHVASTMLAGIDAIQRRFLRECCLTEEDALVFFNLAPLETRRDVAMLGLCHWTVLGCGPRHFSSMFRLAPPSSSQKHCWQLQSHRGPRNLQKLVRSTLGLIDVYNLLPGRVVEQMSVAAMQHELQCLWENQSSAQGRRLAAHFFTSSLSLPGHPLHHFA